MGTEPESIEVDDEESLFARPPKSGLPSPPAARSSSPPAPAWQVGMKRQRSQVQRLRSSELAGRRQSPGPAIGSPRGTSPRGQEGPAKVAKRAGTPGTPNELQVDGAAPGSPSQTFPHTPSASTPRAPATKPAALQPSTPNAGATPQPSPQSVHPAAGAIARTSSPRLHAGGAASPRPGSLPPPSPRTDSPKTTSGSAEPQRPPPEASRAGEGSQSNGVGAAKAVAQTKPAKSGGGVARELEGRARAADRRRAEASKAGGSGAGKGSGKEKQGGHRPGDAAKGGPSSAGKKPNATADAGSGRLKAGVDEAPVKIQQIPELAGKLKSLAMPEVTAGSRGLWSLVSGGEKDKVAAVEGLLDSLADVLHRGSSQARFFSLAVIGELAFFHPQRSADITGRAKLRSGVVAVLRDGRGVEGEAAKVVRNCCANGTMLAEEWALQEGLLQAMEHCVAASEHIKACVVGALYSMSRAPAAAQGMLSGGLPKVLEGCAKDKVNPELSVEHRDRQRVTMACAAMALLNLREASGAGEKAGGAAGWGGLERRALVNVVKAVGAATDGVQFGGVRFSVRAALHALPFAASFPSHVLALCDLGLVELLVAILKDYKSNEPADAGADGGAGAAASTGSSRSGVDDVDLAVKVLWKMGQSGGDAAAACLQRMGVVGAQAVLETVQEQIGAARSGMTLRQGEEATKAAVGKRVAEILAWLQQAPSAAE